MTRIRKTLAQRDDEVRRASAYPAGHRGPVNLMHYEDEERARAAMRLFPRAGLGHATQSGIDFRRTATDNIRGEDVTESFFPNPSSQRPGPEAGPKAIAAWNAFIQAIPFRQRLLHMCVPSYWLVRRRRGGGWETWDTPQI
jgi:hypothetical protein